MHLYPGNWVAIGRAVVYCARSAQAFSAGITFRHFSHCTQVILNFARKKIMKIVLSGHGGIHWRALAEHFQMSSHLPGFQFFLSFLSSCHLD